MPSIENTTIFTGLALSALGGAFYYYTGQASITALIPTFMGAPVLVSGLVLNATENVKVKAGIAHIAVLVYIYDTQPYSSGILLPHRPSISHIYIYIYRLP